MNLLYHAELQRRIITKMRTQNKCCVNLLEILRINILFHNSNYEICPVWHIKIQYSNLSSPSDRDEANLISNISFNFDFLFSYY